MNSNLQYAMNQTEKAQRAAAAERERAYEEQRRQRAEQRLQQEREAREAWERIPEGVKLADLMDTTADLLEKLPNYPVDQEMWYFKTALTNCVMALQFLLKEQRI